MTGSSKGAAALLVLGFGFPQVSQAGYEPHLDTCFAVVAHSSTGELCERFRLNASDHWTRGLTDMESTNDTTMTPLPSSGHVCPVDVAQSLEAQKQMHMHAAHELSRLQDLVQVAPREALRTACERVLGQSCSPNELREFLFHAAPIARRMHLGQIDGEATFGRYKVKDIRSWYWWLDSIDPLSARMVDLRYYAGMGVKESAALLDLPPSAILRDVRFAKDWLNIELPPLEGAIQGGT